ncbi:2-isopropylmalate synthase [Oxobacter pfennigii]|uniref:Citramalate synthase n=1 Tax=Oxobacter pfennigii TaxID=36849 RepID=A0A0P9AJQ8_9CLOT|nr:citramalate synthase [Oxobacter pfennigii]KPU45628.1 2-isopropylmalate synthase [Oxobacter pfennigii]
MVKKICIYDSTLRDGAQGEGISFTVADKLKITAKLDGLGVDYIEAGNPGSNPKDIEFFQRLKELKLKNAKLTAFGSTRRANVEVDKDANIMSLLSAETPSVAIFGKSWDFHVTDIIRTTLEENLCMIRDTVRYMKHKDKEVIYDAEHFFDGYKANPSYAIDTLEAALQSGADWITLCDTNGGTLPNEIRDIVKKVIGEINAPIGIHCHNDGGMAVANSIMAVIGGVTQVQGTMNGYGERCGNADLCTIIPNLEIKLKYRCLPEGALKELTAASRFISELANMTHYSGAPFVGHSAFAHKGGMHIDGVSKNPHSFEHIPPELVGNSRRFLMSEVSGRSTVLTSIQKVDPAITKDSEETYNIIAELKRLEHEGYQFEGAESSFELVIRRALGRYKKLFEVSDFKVISDEPWSNGNSATAIIKIWVNGVQELTASEGDGPVNALDIALRKALTVFYPQLNKMRLVDYKVRVLDTTTATAAKVRVHIESTDGERSWGTVGVSTNILEASWIALVDSIEYMLIKYMD